MSDPRSLRSITVCAIALIALTALDLWTKEWAVRELSRERTSKVAAACTPDAEGQYSMQRLRGESIVLVPDYLEFRYAENCGAAFGLLDDAPRWLRVVVFMGAGIVAIAALLWMFVRGHGGKLFAASVPLVASGALGNMVDRLRLGYVVDFIHFHIRDGFEWPTFNVADSTITVGVALLLLDGLRGPAPRATEQAAEQPDAGKA
jgi:signal peptidase II